MSKKISIAFITILTIFLLSSLVTAENSSGANTTLQFHLQKEVVVYNASTTYDGLPQTPVFSEGDLVNELTQSDIFEWGIYPKDTVLEGTMSNDDWIESVTDAGMYDLYVTIKNDDYYLINDLGEKTDNIKLIFTILPYDFSSEVSCNVNSSIYTGSIIQPTGTCSLNWTTLTSDDYYLTASKNGSDINAKNAETYDVVIHGIGNYTGTKTFSDSFVIQPKDISGNDITINYTNAYTYTGQAITPGVAMTYNGISLIQDVDFTLSYDENIDVGDDASIIITGKGNFKESKTINFSINKVDLLVTITNGTHVYDGKSSNGGARITATTIDNTSPTIKFKTTASGNYTLESMPTFTDVGTYTVYFRATADNHNDYNGTVTIRILKATNSLLLDKNSIYLTGESVGNINFTTTFPDNVSYVAGENDVVTVSIDNVNKKITLTPKKRGTQTLTFTTEGSGNFLSATADLSVTVDFGEISVQVEGENIFTYDKNPHSLTLSYTPADASINYSWTENGTELVSSLMPSFINSGHYVVSYVVSKTNYETYFGTVHLIINPKNINDESITATLSSLTFEYDGNIKKPTVVVKDGNDTLVEGVDYYLSYTDNILPTENAQVIITGMGNYTGSKTLTFTIASSEISYQKQNGVAQYSGYKTWGDSPRAQITVSNDIKYNISYKANQTDSSYTLVSMPKFINVGEHTVYFKIEAIGYETIEDSLTITINKRQLSIPRAFEDLYYTGMSQSPTWLNYNSFFMEISGESKATLPGTYEATFHLNNENVEWDDHTTSDKTVEWRILNVSIKDRETVKEFEIAYNEEKQISIDNGQNTFKRTGYSQIAWVESCQDGDLRTCNYDRYIKINETPHLNSFDTGSTIKGSYVAKQVNYDNSQAYNLYAVWTTSTYKVKYELCDEKSCGTFTNSPTTIVSYDDTFYVPNPVREGYLFMGWEISGMDKTPHVIGNETITDKTFIVPEEWIGLTQEEKAAGVTITCKNLTSIQNGLVTFKALWSPIKYRVIFYPNKESCLDDNGVVTTAILSGNTASNYPVAYDSTVTLTKNGFILNGYTFVNWNTNPDGTGTSYEDEEEISNLTTIEEDTITLYAQWERNANTEFKVTYWKQGINKNNNHNTTNYKNVGEETYTGETDSNIIITPYSYKGTNTSDAIDEYGYIKNTSQGTGNTDKLAISSEKGVTFYSSNNSSLKDDFFYGFTPETNGDNSLNEGYKYTISPNGDRNINIYYTRNTYELNFETNGGDNYNPEERQYEVEVTFENPTDGNLENGNNDFGQVKENNQIINNSGKGNFAGWFRNPTIQNSANGVKGNVTTDETLYAFWIQHRYSIMDGNNWTWTNWGRKQIETPPQSSVITLYGKRYLVLDANGNEAKLMYLENDLSSAFGNNNTYAGSTVDTYLNETWYNSLNANMRRAIVAQNISQSVYTYYSDTSGEIDGVGTDCVYSLTKTGSSNIGQRYVYMIDLDDIIEYLGENNLTAEAFIGMNNKGSLPTNSKYITVRSAATNSNKTIYMIAHGKGRPGHTDNTFGGDIRPVFVIDLSQVNWTY